VTEVERIRRVALVARLIGHIGLVLVGETRGAPSTEVAALTLAIAANVGRAAHDAPPIRVKRPSTTPKSAGVEATIPRSSVASANAWIVAS